MRVVEFVHAKVFGVVLGVEVSVLILVGRIGQVGRFRHVRWLVDFKFYVVVRLLGWLIFLWVWFRVEGIGEVYFNRLFRCVDLVYEICEIIFGLGGCVGLVRLV